MSSNKQILITKADGNKVPFDIDILRASLRRVGASEDITETIVNNIQKTLKDGMHTSEIYRHAFSLLRKTEHPLAARYSMKRAILSLGPSGFPFENFVAEIFRAKGYTATVGIMIQGKCTKHEVDIFLKKDSIRIGAELKFHNRQGTKSALKDALYVSARFLDIKQSQKDKHGEDIINEGWFITNTKFTKNAIHYGMCSGLKMISWGYPQHGNLRDLIEETHVQPVTCLSTLSQKDKVKLMDNKIVLCRSVHKNENVLRSLGMNSSKIKSVIEESNTLCGQLYGV